MDDTSQEKGGVRKRRHDKVISSCGMKSEISNYHLRNTELLGNSLGKTVQNQYLSIDSMVLSIFGGH